MYKRNTIYDIHLWCRYDAVPNIHQYHYKFYTNIISIERLIWSHLHVNHYQNQGTWENEYIMEKTVQCKNVLNRFYCTYKNHNKN